LDDVSDGPSEITSQSNDGSSATVTTEAGSSETSRRGRRNRRDRHKNGSKLMVDSAAQLSETEPKTHWMPQSTVGPADLQSSVRNKSSVINSSSATSNVIGRDMTSRGSGADPVKLTSLAVCAPPSASITGNS